jgi:hypothetical protein
MRPLKSLTLEAVVTRLSDTFNNFPDDRDSDRISYPLHDSIMSGFAMFFFQHPSLLEFQRRMKQRRGRCNLQTIFGVSVVPSDTQMRDLLDDAPTEPLRLLLGDLFEGVRRAGWAKDFKTTIPTGNHQGNYYTVMLDGTQYFHSTKIECPSCLRKSDSSGQTHYSHSIVSATLVRAGSHRVFPLDVEEVRNSDGDQKQDCELNAAKRLIQRVRGEHPQMGIIIGGDDLYSHEPYVELLQSNRLHYLLVAKPESHKEIFEWVEEIDRLAEAERGRWEEGPACKRRSFEYRVVRGVPLSSSRKIWVTFIEVWERDKRGELLYHNSWITDLEVDSENVTVVVQIGRSRWKIENEQFNVQKNHGYELEHNYGHGKKRLSQVFYLLNLLAFVAHQILERGERLYQESRGKGSLRELWEGLRSIMKMMLVDSWRQMLEIYIEASSP